MHKNLSKHREQNPERNKHYNICEQKCFLVVIFTPPDQKTPVDAAIISGLPGKTRQLQDTVYLAKEEKSDQKTLPEIFASFSVQAKFPYGTYEKYGAREPGCIYTATGKVRQCRFQLHDYEGFYLRHFVQCRLISTAG